MSVRGCVAWVLFSVLLVALNLAAQDARWACVTAGICLGAWITNTVEAVRRRG